MHREEIQNLLSDFGFAETLNRTLKGINTTHMIHRSEGLRKIVEYYIDPVGIVKSIWGFSGETLSVIESSSDFEIWLKK